MSDGAIFLFCRTSNMARPWADAGVTCYLVDIQHAKGERRESNLVYVGADARYWRPPVRVTPIFVACFPPCTHLAVSGARWFKGKGLRLLAESIELFAVAAELCEWAGCPYFIENPVSVVSSHWRKPDHTFHPWEYAGYLPEIENENTTKLTASGLVAGSLCQPNALRLHRIETTSGRWRQAQGVQTSAPYPPKASPSPYSSRTYRIN